MRCSRAATRCAGRCRIGQLNFTSGVFIFSSSMVNVGIGLLLE
jgi:hypothetical protein